MRENQCINDLTLYFIPSHSSHQYIERDIMPDLCDSFIGPKFLNQFTFIFIGIQYFSITGIDIVSNICSVAFQVTERPRKCSSRMNISTFNIRFSFSTEIDFYVSSCPREKSSCFRVDSDNVAFETKLSYRDVIHVRKSHRSHLSSVSSKRHDCSEFGRSQSSCSKT